MKHAPATRGPHAKRIGRSSGLRLACLTTACFFGVLGVAVVLHRLPLFVPVLYACLSCVAFSAYAFDKRAAIRGRRRITENFLQMLALAGGWPGALLAQQLFRHKSRKPAFRRQLFCGILLNGAALLAFYLYFDAASRWFSGIGFMVPN